MTKVAFDAWTPPLRKIWYNERRGDFPFLRVAWFFVWSYPRPCFRGLSLMTSSSPDYANGLLFCLYFWFGPNFCLDRLFGVFDLTGCLNFCLGYLSGPLFFFKCLSFCLDCPFWVFNLAGCPNFCLRISWQALFFFIFIIIFYFWEHSLAAPWGSKLFHF